MTDTISLEESFECALRSFLEWLDVMTMEPLEQCDSWGNYNVAWELVSDLEADGRAVVEMSCSYLDERQKGEVRAFLSGLKRIPQGVLVSATTAEANLRAMSHPSWKPHKKAAATLIQCLESAAGRNRDALKGEAS